MKKTFLSVAVAGLLLTVGISIPTVFAATDDVESYKNETQTTSTNSSIENNTLFTDVASDKNFAENMIAISSIAMKEQMSNEGTEGVKKATPLVSYTVQKGDTVESITTMFEVDATDFFIWNKELATTQTVEAGQTIKVRTTKDAVSIQAQRVAEVEAAEQELARIAQEAEAAEEALAKEAAAQAEREVQEQAASAQAEQESLPTVVATPEVHSATPTGRTFTVTASAYSFAQPGLSNFTALGIDLSVNPQVIAVDPSIIPLGSRVYVEGYGEAIAGDTGGDIIGNRIDVHFPSVSACFGWGMRSVQITILD